MLGSLDYILIFAFLIATAGIGIAARGKQEKTGDYFISKGSLPGFLGSTVIGLSIAATFFSGISFLAYPSVVFNSGLVILAGLSTFVLFYFLVVHFFAPRYASRGWKAPYEILEVRFGVGIRKLTSLLYILMRLGWMAALIYAPTVGILGAAGLGSEYFWPVAVCVGLISTIYSAFGGLRGIMVTDALQMLVIIGGCMVTILFILFNLPAPLGEVVARLNENGRIRLFDFSTDPGVTVTTYAALIGTFFATLGMYFGDQMALQRYLTNASQKDLKKSFLINVIGVILILLILACIGLGLAAWFEFFPDAPRPEDSDRIFPFFVASELPSGIAGLILAALLAATMSSMTSGINALSGAIQMDLLPGFLRNRSEANKLRFARRLSFGIGLAATAATGLVAQLGQIFDITQRLLGVFLGPIAVCFIFAILPLRVLPGFVGSALIGGCLVGMAAAVSPQINASWSAFPVIGSMWTAPLAVGAALIFTLPGIRPKGEGRNHSNSSIHEQN